MNVTPCRSGAQSAPLEGITTRTPPTTTSWMQHSPVGMRMALPSHTDIERVRENLKPLFFYSSSLIQFFNQMKGHFEDSSASDLHRCENTIRSLRLSWFSYINIFNILTFSLYSPTKCLQTSTENFRCHKMSDFQKHEHWKIYSLHSNDSFTCLPQDVHFLHLKLMLYSSMIHAALTVT